MIVEPGNARVGMQMHISSDNRPYSPLPIGSIYATQDDGARVHVQAVHSDLKGHKLCLAYDEEATSCGPGWRIVEDDPLKPGKSCIGRRYSSFQLELR